MPTPADHETGQGQLEHDAGQVRDQIEPAAKALDLLRHFRLGQMLERLLSGVVYLPVRDLGGNHGQEYQDHHEDEMARAEYQFVKVVKAFARRRRLEPARLGDFLRFGPAIYAKRDGSPG